MSNDGTIDITDLVEKMRTTFVSVETDAAQAALLASVPWTGMPIIKTIVRGIIQIVLDSLSKRAVQQAFFLNTAIRKASQAEDYVSAITAKASLPEGVSDADYAKAEQAEIDAFNRFVRVTN